MIKRFLILFLLSGMVQGLLAKKVAIFCVDSEQAYGDSKEDFKILGKSIKEAGFELVSDYPKSDGVLDKIAQGFGTGQVDCSEAKQQKKRVRDDFEAPKKNDAVESFIDRYKECDFIICFFAGTIGNMFVLNNCCLSFISEENTGKLIIFNLVQGQNYWLNLFKQMMCFLPEKFQEDQKYFIVSTIEECMGVMVPDAKCTLPDLSTLNVEDPD